MKLLRGFINFFFNFGKKYRKREVEYHNSSKRFGTSGHLVTLVLYSSVPLLSLWGVFALPWEGGLAVLKLFCFLGCILIFQAPAELMITGIVALRHRLRMKVQNKVEGAMIAKTAEVISGQELTEEAKLKATSYEARGTAYRYDLLVGILGIALSVLVIAAFVSLLFVFLFY